MTQSISKRVAGDRAVASFFAFIASLPALAAIGGVGFLVASHIAENGVANIGADGGYVVLALLALFAFLFYVIARWTYDSVHAALTPQRVQAMWLRRFQAERGDTFRTSRVIDQLSRHGVSALTLQDRDVQLSFEQRRNRLAPIFWLLFIPIALAIGFVLWNGWQAAQADLLDMPQARDLREGIGQIFAAFIGLIAIGVIFIAGFFFAIMATMLAVMGIAAISGPLGAMMSKGRDDYATLPRLLQQLQRGKRRGASVVRISDTHWRDAVISSLGAVDVALIDLTSVTDHIAWEISEAVKACGAAGLVFICSDRDGRMLAPQAKAAVRGALGREPGAIVFYPARRGGDSKRFARDLRQAIYAAADAKAVA